MSGLVRAESLFRARRRQVERRRVAMPLLVLACLTTIGGGSVWAALYSPLLRLDTVEVVGTGRLTPSQVLTAARVRLHGSLVTVATGRVQRDVAALPAVASVAVRRSWPHTLVIRVVERQPVAVVGTRDGAAELLDAGGTAFAVVTGAPGGLLDLRVAPPALGRSAPAAAAALSVWQALPAGLRGAVRSVAAATPDAVVLDLRSGAEVVWGSPGDTAAKVTALAGLARQRARVYDVSTPAVPVTR